ncbi:MAG: adenine phosphoribosyltransferase [Nanoarchaeota archaeon]
MDLKNSIRSIKDFPKKGVYYRDLNPIYLNPEAFKEVINKLLAFAKSKSPNKIVSIESSGFIIGSVLAKELGIGFAPIRKYGKLPFEVLRAHFPSDFRDTTLEIQLGAVKKNEKVIICDDLIATGGTAKVAAEMVEELGAKIVGIAAIAELDYLKGRELLKQHELFTLIKFKKQNEI